MTRRQLAILAGVLAIALLLPVAAAACPVCFSGSPKVRIAIFNSTVFLSLLPLGMIGAGMAWLKRLGRHLLPGEFEDRDAYVPPAPSDEGAPGGA